MPSTAGYRLAILAYGAVLIAWVTPALIAGFQWVAMFDFLLWVDEPSDLTALGLAAGQLDR